MAEAFIDFLWSQDAQRAYGRYGLRPVDETVLREVQAQFPPVEDLWKIDFLGGWKTVGTEIYGPQGIYTKMFDELHGSK